jgi:hypothetical protein
LARQARLGIPQIKNEKIKNGGAWLLAPGETCLVLVTAASEGSLLFDQYRPFDIFKLKN